MDQIFTMFPKATKSDTCYSDDDCEEFSLVKFHSVPKHYMVGETPLISYTVDSLVHQTNKDWVGLFPARFRLLSEGVCKVRAARNRKGENTTQNKHLIVPARYMMKVLEGDQYQWVYVSKRGLVLGRSSPFIFSRVVFCKNRPVTLLDFVNINDGRKVARGTLATSNPVEVYVDKHPTLSSQRELMVEDSICKKQSFNAAFMLKATTSKDGEEICGGMYNVQDLQQPVLEHKNMVDPIDNGLCVHSNPANSNSTINSRSVVSLWNCDPFKDSFHESVTNAVEENTMQEEDGCSSSNSKSEMIFKLYFDHQLERILHKHWQNIYESNNHGEMKSENAFLKLQNTWLKKQCKRKVAQLTQKKADVRMLKNKLLLEATERDHLTLSITKLREEVVRSRAVEVCVRKLCNQRKHLMDRLATLRLENIKLNNKPNRK